MCFFFQAEDGIRDLVRSRGLGDVYKRQTADMLSLADIADVFARKGHEQYAGEPVTQLEHAPVSYTHLTLPTSDLV